MAYGVRFRAPERKLGKADLVFKVSKDDQMLGRLKVSKGGVEWLVSSGKRAYKMRWAKFAELMEEHGKRK